VCGGEINTEIISDTHLIPPKKGEIVILGEKEYETIEFKYKFDYEYYTTIVIVINKELNKYRLEKERLKNITNYGKWI
jgi:hypothetical protein